ncbi:DUF58 domain-containing protein [Candidatus Cryosericum hinesii]|jgi:uncharacterized protein (DUF58 family)|uniref:DUF58 domain-containing protein n=1 Tax=Candidatus Cryosericum hinesii TaxID=2290915 RepID=A0A398DPH0_9BACT|nr:DUF58 domain-containing protein [Candidatus Cryosericum hinesii]RIE08627.1 DUF58 domain-containing protein [Candidatus Cryosericum hinesii]RIE12454.1 DUF58 domain-containing protein [Candidatus Cryosericum hinesii]RIE12651.1 DUF58 domain-containing protein [Candidatus Cryosericum hinesii]
MRRILRVAGRAILISSLATVSWLILGTRSLFYLATLITTYTAIMVPLVLRTSDRISVVKRLRQAVVQMKSQDTLTISLEGIPRRSPLSIQLEPLVPEYIIRESSSWHDRTYVLQFHVNRRGVYDLGECILTVTDPLRLFRISRRLIADEKLTVFPTVLPLEKLRISLTSPLDGQRVKFAPNYDVSQLAGVRPYESDPMNRIHWKMSAHRGELMVKEFAPSASKTVVILLNLTLRREPSFTLETFEDYMTMVGASVLQYSYDHKLPFGLTVLGEETLSSNSFSKDATHLFACYRLLAHARARMDREPSSTVFLDYLRRERLRIPARSQLFLIQHELKEEEIGALLRMQGQFSRISICLFPYGSFLLYGERAVPYFMPDIEQIARLKKTQRILRDASVDLSIIGLNDTLAALGET